jgi:hypothetical protein
VGGTDSHDRGDPGRALTGGTLLSCLSGIERFGRERISMRLLLKRTVLLAALAAVIPLSAGAQDACTADFGTHVGSPACPYQWVGATTVLYDGSGNGLGFIGMTSECRGEFGAGARMCTSQEIMDSDTNNLNAIPAVGCWVRPSWRPNGGSSSTLDESGLSFTSSSMTCNAWTRADSGQTGLLLGPEGSMRVYDQGTGFEAQCDIPRSVACCKPTPVPAPSASLSLPIGTMGLLGLSMLKGSV